LAGLRPRLRRRRAHEHAAAYARGVVADVDRQNGWQPAERAGDAHPRRNAPARPSKRRHASSAPRRPARPSAGDGTVPERIPILEAVNRRRARPQPSGSAGRPAARSQRAGCRAGPARIARRRSDPVVHAGLADRRVSERVAGGFAGAVAAGCRARPGAGWPPRRDRAPHGPLWGGKRPLPGVRRLVGRGPQQLRASPRGCPDRRPVGRRRLARPAVSLPPTGVPPSDLRRAAGRALRGGQSRRRRRHARRDLHAAEGGGAHHRPARAHRPGGTHRPHPVTPHGRARRGAGGGAGRRDAVGRGLVLRPTRRPT
jgi:hypothetical protein